jgi:hypothetical protein
MAAFIAWLDGAAVTVFAICALLFTVLNIGAIALVYFTRDRALVNRWTARWLAANLLLIGAGAGVPVAAKVAHLTMDAVAGINALRADPIGERDPSEKELGK